MDNCFNQLILNKIYTNLSLNDLKNCSQVNKKFNRAFNNDALWKFLFNKDYTTIKINIFRDVYLIDNYKIIYQKCKDISFIKDFCRINKEIDSLINSENKFISETINYDTQTNKFIDEYSNIEFIL